MNLDIYRGIEVNLIIKIDDRTRLIRQLLGEDIIKSSFNSHDILDIAIGDYIIYDSVKYYVNNLPNVKKNATNSFSYNITFESEYYELLKTQFMDLDGNSDFDLVGDLETFIDLIVTNMNRTHSDWTKGTCDQTNVDYKLLNFSKYNCMQVLQKLCNDFEGEFYFDGKDICFTDKAGSDSGYTFIYKQGLRNIQRTTLSEKNIITRLYAFGSEKNLSSDYRDHSKRLKFVDGGLSYLEKNVGEYGTIEHTEIFEDIYPHREGTISAVDGADITKFSDSGMDFNLNDYLLPGVTAKLHFNSGDLGGYEFEVSAYNNATKEFTIIAYKDEVGYEMPNATLKPAIGDKYVLLEIYLPQSYIDTAETALQAKAQTYLDDNCDPRVTYILTPDPRYFKTHFIDLKAGDFITIEDTDLGIDVMTRIVELTKSVADEYKYTLKLTDHLEVQLIQRLYSEQEDLKEKIEIGYGGDIIRSRRNWRTSEELRTMVFDTDDYFDMGNIRPASVETSMLSVGAKSTQFILKEIEVEANYESDVSKFHASAGSLIHLSIADEIRTWTLSANDQDSLVDGTPYYIYAKCTKDPGYTGQVIVDSVQRKFDDDPTYYYFLIGVLHSVVDSVRGISLTYGQTIINGKFIKTGKIESTDETAYLDLDNNIIMLPDATVTADKIALNSITADKYNELRNTYVFNGDDSLDASFPFELDFEIVSEMTAINSVKLSFRISQFRAYTKAGAAAGTPSGGGATSGAAGTPSGGGATSGEEDKGHQHNIIIYDSHDTTYPVHWTAGGLVAATASNRNVVTSTANQNHTHTTPDHTHPNHTHTTPDHTHPNHTHTAVYGIYEDSQSPTIHYHIDNGAGYGAASADFTTDQLGIDITASISGTGFKRIKFDSNVRCRIRAWVLCKIDLSA